MVQFLEYILKTFFFGTLFFNFRLLIIKIMEKSIVEIQETVENGKKIAELYLGSQLTIQNDLDNIIETLLPLFQKNEEINFLSQRNTEIDISLIQILIAAKKFGNEKNVPVHFNFHLSPVSKDLLKLSGLQHIFK